MNFSQSVPALYANRRDIEKELARLWAERQTLLSKIAWIDNQFAYLQAELKQMNQE